MKKTKLLTSLVALALVLGLGACGETDDEKTTAGEDETSSQTTEEDVNPNTPSEPTAYALVGDFIDSNWDESPDIASKYYIAAGTASYKVTVETSSAPEDSEDWETWGPWSAGLRVVEYGTWNLVAGYGQLDAASTGVLGEGSDNNVGVNWNANYDLTITLGDNPSILVKQQLDPVANPAEFLERVNDEGNYSITLYDNDWVPNNPISYDDYLSYQQGNEEAVAKYNAMFDDVYLQSSVRYDIYYMEDCVLAHKFELVDDSYNQVQTEILVNDDGTLWDYVSEDDLNWEADSQEEKTWQELHYSLFDAYDYGVGDCFVLQSSDDGLDSYTLEGKPSGKSYDASAYWFAMGGEDFVYGRSNALTNGRYYYNLDGIEFSESLQQIDTQYHCDWIEVDMSLNLNVRREVVTSSAYDAGTTDCSEVCNYCHNFWQAVLRAFD